MKKFIIINKNSKMEVATLATFESEREAISFMKKEAKEEADDIVDEILFNLGKKHYNFSMKEGKDKISIFTNTYMGINKNPYRSTYKMIEVEA
jgi:hypothetical protein